MPNAKCYWKNVKKIKKDNAEYYVRNRKRVLARNKAWNAAHPEVISKSTKEWSDKHPERRAKTYKEYHKRHKKARNAFCRKYCKENPEIILASSRRRRARKKKAEGSFSAAEWKALCRQYGHKCLGCGKRKKLTADHVVPLSKGGSNYISNIQTLCGPCNSSKRDKTIDYRRRNPYARQKRNP